MDLTITDADIDSLLHEKSAVRCNYMTPIECEYEACYTGPCIKCPREMLMCVLHVGSYLEFLETAEENHRWVVCKMCNTKALSETLRELIRNI
jgi:hypothetical protein